MFNRFVVCLWAIFFAVPFCLGQGSSATEEHLAELFAQAQAAQQQADYRTAAKCYEEIVKLRPDVPEAWANLGLMHQFLEEYPEADRNFQIALSKNPRLYVPNLFLGLNQLRERQPAKALHYLKTAENLNSKDEQAALGLARAYQAAHEDLSASKWFSRAAEINPADSDAWYGLGTAYLSLQDEAVIELGRLGQNGPYARALVAEAFVTQGRTKDAIIIYNQLLAGSIGPPCLLAAVGFAYVPQDSDIAKKSFEDQLRKSPGCLSARLGLAHLAVGKEDFAGVLKELQVAWDADRPFVRANVQRVWKGADPDQLSKAGAYLRQSLPPQDALAGFLLQSIEAAGGATAHPEGAELNDDPVSVVSKMAVQSADSLLEQGHYTACENKLRSEKTAASPARALLLAQCAYYSGDYRTSLTASADAFKANPQSAPALYWKAKSSQELAAAALERMGAAAPDSAKVHLLLAELHRARDEFAAAETEYNQVIDSGNNDPAAHLGLAQVYYQESLDDKVLQQLQFVLKADPTSPQGSLLMGQVLVRRHQYAEALPFLKSALDGSPLSRPLAHSLIARCLGAQGDYAGALAELKPALSADKAGIFHYQLYQIYQKLGDSKAAAAALQESEKLRREATEAEQKQKMTRQSEPNP